VCLVPEDVDELIENIRSILVDVLDSDDEDTVEDTASCLYDLAEKVRRLDAWMVGRGLIAEPEVGQ
jgi:hypothetical protein